jgi:hypothetical protein
MFRIHQLPPEFRPSCVKSMSHASPTPNALPLMAPPSLMATFALTPLAAKDLAT